MTSSIQTEPRGIRNTSGIKPSDYSLVPMVDLLDKERCYHELRMRMHPDGLSCSCGSQERMGHGKTAAGFPVFRCRACGKTYTILSGTPFSGTKLDARRIVLFMRLWAAGERVDRIGREIGLHRNSVQMLMTKLTVYGKYSGECS